MHRGVILEDDKPEQAVDVPPKTDEPFEIKELLDEYLAAVATQRTNVACWRPRPGVVILAIRKPDGQIIFNPPADIEISEDDYLIAMGAVPALLALDVVKRAG